MRKPPFIVLALLTTAAAVALPAPARPGAPAGSVGEEPARTDRYGDPLPKEAVLRLGTVRLRQPFLDCIAFSPDGKLLASGGSDNRVRLWDPDTGKEVGALEGHKHHVNDIAFSGDGKWLASGSQDGELFLWEVDAGKVRRRFPGHAAAIERLALSPNGKVLASRCQGGALRLWDTDTGKEIRSLPIDRGRRVSPLAFSPDSKFLAFHNRPEKGIQLVDVAVGKEVRRFMGHKDEVDGLAFRADGAVLFSGGNDKTIRAWDVATGKELRRYGDGKGMVRCLALAPDGKTLTYGTFPDSGGLVHIWDLTANKDRVPPWKAHRYCVVSIAYSPDSKKVAVARDTIAIHDTATGKRLDPATENGNWVGQVGYAAGGKVLAVLRQDKTIELWDTAKGRKLATLQARRGMFTSMAVSPDGKYLTTAEGDFEQAALCHWDPRTGERLKEYPQEGRWIYSLSYSADGKTLAWMMRAGRDRVLVRSDPQTGTERGRFTLPRGAVNLPRLSPDGRLLVCETLKHAVALLDADKGEAVRSFGKGSFGPRKQIAVSPDGRTIATPGGEGVADRIPIHPDVVLWETATGQERLTIPMNAGNVSDVVFSPDGRVLACAGRTETIHLWDAWTGKKLGRLTGHRGWINALGFAPDGKTLASGGADGTVLIWDVSGFLPTARPVAGKLGPKEQARCWDDLVGTDAARAYRAMAELARRPGQAEGLLEDKLAGHPGVSAERLARLIADLDKDDFKTREKASKELTNLGRLAEGALRKALDETASAEVKRRVRELLGKLNGKAEDPEKRRLLRVVEVLERLGTPRARRLLGNLAKEAAVADVAREAKASLGRLGQAGKGAP
jgi:WD40 repeat protein